MKDPSGSPDTIVSVITTLFSVKTDIELLGMELSRHHEQLWCNEQINKISSLYSSLDEAIRSLRRFVGLEQDIITIPQNLHEKIKDEYPNDTEDIKEDTTVKAFLQNNIVDTEENFTNHDDHPASPDKYETNTANGSIAANCVKVEMEEFDQDENDENLDTFEPYDALDEDFIKKDDGYENDDDRPSRTKRKSKKQKEGSSCKKKGANGRALPERIVHQDLDTETLICKVCGYQGGTLKSLKNHMTVKHTIAQYSCDTCQQKFRTATMLRGHINTEHLGIRHQCDQCDYFAKRAGDLAAHIDVVHRVEKYKCDKCDYETKAKKLLASHVKYKHQGLSFKCKLCSFEAKFSHRLRDHMDSVHDNAVYQCDECSYTCNTKTKLNEHFLNYHKNKEELLCSKCTYKTLSAKYLYYHMQQVHLETVNSKQCTFCDYTCKHAFTLKKHIAKNHSDKPYERKEYFCDHCEYVASDRNTLTSHMKYKHEGIMHDCTICGLKYSRMSLVYRHMRRKHPGELPPKSRGAPTKLSAYSPQTTLPNIISQAGLPHFASQLLHQDKDEQDVKLGSMERAEIGDL